MHDDSSDDLLALVRETPPPAGQAAGEAPHASELAQPTAVAVSLPSVHLPPLAVFPGPNDAAVQHTVRPASALTADTTAPLPSAHPVHSVVPLSGRTEIVRRQTARPTAGHHSNPHHLPRPANEAAQAGPSRLQSNAVSAFFRPW